jgi:N utilization substance protein B
MTRRSRAREVALQMLFQFDFNPGVPRLDLERFARERLRDPDLVRFCLELYDGVRSRHDAIDQMLAQAAENWRLPRMAAVDRNVLRLGCHELFFSADTPPRVALDEAIELARRYGSADSPGFVNGVLDNVYRRQLVEMSLNVGALDDSPKGASGAESSAKPALTGESARTAETR